MSTTIIRARVDKRNAASAKKILSNIGLKPADAVSMLMAQIVAHRGIPFAVQEGGYDYAQREYGATKEDVDDTYARMKRNIARARKAGTLKEVRSIEDLRG